MKRTRIAILMLFGCAAAFAIRAAAEREAAESEIRAARQQFVDAVNAGDLDAFMALVAEDAVFLVEGRPAIEGRAPIRAIGEQVFRSGQGRRLEVEIIRLEHSGRLAYEYSRYRRWPGGEESGAAPVAGKYVDVWRRESDGAWRITVHAPSDDVRSGPANP